MPNEYNKWKREMESSGAMGRFIIFVFVLILSGYWIYMLLF